MQNEANSAAISKINDHIQGTFDYQQAEDLTEWITRLSGKDPSDDALAQIVKLLLEDAVFEVGTVKSPSDDPEDDIIKTRRLSSLNTLNSLLEDTNVRVIPMGMDTEIAIVSRLFY